MPALDSSWLKHEWSQRHLNLLYNEFSVFYRNEDKPSGSYDDSDSGTKLTHKPFEVPPLPEWSLILGDAIHNMRSALDHIAYALALKHLSTQKAGRLPDRRTSFPLLPVPNSGQFANATGDIEPDARKEIERLQPYNGGQPLKFLSELDVADKHHRLVLHSARISMTGSITLSAGTVTEIGFADGRVFAVNPTTGERTEHLQPNMTPSITLEVQLSRIGGSVPLSAVQEAHDFIGNDVIPVFARFFT